MSPTPQAVVTPLTPAAIFLVMTIEPGAEAEVADVLSQVSGIRRAVGFRSLEGGLTCVTSIGSDAWDRLFSGPRPARLHPFQAVAGPRHTAPSTPGDLLFHIRAQRLDLCFALAQEIVKALGPTVSVVDEVHGFRSFEDRDLLGFVDGTENPEDGEALDASLVGDEDPEFSGGSYVIVQKYVHDLPAWDGLSVEAQEHAVGRSKLDDIEMSDAEKPPNAHIVLNQVENADGEELSILRFNMPFGSVGQGVFGTYFIGYCASPAVTEEMLDNMFLGKPAGVTDRLLDFSTALTGGLFFTPSVDFLDDPPPLPGDAAEPAPVPAASAEEAADETDHPAPPAPDDGSLGIGSLKGST